MKFLLFVIGVPFFWASCRGKADKVQDFIPGIYVNAARGEFGQARDTLEISPEGELHYRMERRTAYRALRKGKLLPERHKVAVFLAVFDPEKLELLEPQSGRVFRFDRGKKELLIRSAVYLKLR